MSQLIFNGAFVLAMLISLQTTPVKFCL